MIGLRQLSVIFVGSSVVSQLLMKSWDARYAALECLLWAQWNSLKQFFCYEYTSHKLDYTSSRSCCVIETHMNF